MQQAAGNWFFGKVAPYLDFVLHEVVLRRRFVWYILTAAIIAFGVWMFLPKLSNMGEEYIGLGLPSSIWWFPLFAWAFAASLLISVILDASSRWRSHLRGPSGVMLGGVVFAGFYETDAKGRLYKGGQSIPLEQRFLDSLDRELKSHRVNTSGLEIAAWPIQVTVVDWRSPKGFAESHDQESFRAWLKKLSRQSVGVVWGTVTHDGLPPLERTRSPYATLASPILSSSKSAGLL